MNTRIEQANRSRDPLAAIELLDEMESWSEYAFCAGWHVGLAEMVDSAISGGYRVGEGFGLVEPETLATFRRCREACGGTWIFGGIGRDMPSRAFVTEEEWDAMGRKEPVIG